MSIWLLSDIRLAINNRTLRGFSHSGYRVLWTSNFLSYFARWMQVTVLGWFVLELTDSPLLVSLVGFFGWMPVFTLGMYGGLLADISNRKIIILSTQASGLISTFVMAILLLLGTGHFWYAYPLMLITGIAWALDMPSRRSAIHDLVGTPGVTNGVALDSAGMSAARMLGPATAGLMISTVGFGLSYAFITSVYFLATLLILRFDMPTQNQDQGYRKGVLRDLSIGLRYVASNQALLAVILTTMIMNILMFPYVNMIPIISRDILHVEADLMGILQASAGGGAVVGAVVVASVLSVRYHGRLFLIGSMVTMITLFIFSFSSWYLLSFILLFVLGIGHSGFSTMQSTSVMLVSLPEMRGKALGVVNLAIGSQPFGALLIGLVAERMGPNFAITLHSIVGALCLLLIGITLPSIWQTLQPDKLQS